MRKICVRNFFAFLLIINHIISCLLTNYKFSHCLQLLTYNLHLKYFKMYGICQMFIIVAITYSSYTVLADESDNCDCNVLQIYDKFGVIGIQNFTKQNNTHNGNPIYFSTLQNMITSNDDHWTYYQYNAAEKMFYRKRTYSKQDFESFKNKCKNFGLRYISEISQCLRDNSNCSGTREAYWNTQNIDLQAKNA